MPGPEANRKRLWVLLVHAQLDAGLSDLPVVGTYVPHDVDVRLKALAFTGVSDVDVANAKTATVNALLAELRLADSTLRLPEKLTAKAHFGVLVQLGTEVRELAAPATQNKKKMAPSSPSDGTGLVVSAGGAGEGTGTLWYPVGKGLGPLRLERLGVRYADKTIFLLVDAGLSVQGLTLSGRGMGLGVTLTTPIHIRGSLEGLGLSWSREPIGITGALVLRDDPNYVVLVQGCATITTPALMLSAVGGYAQKKNREPSMFVFGRLVFGEGEGVGPPPFRITGAAAGFGYNSAVRSPTLEEVDQFPLMPSTTPPADPLTLLDQLQGGVGGTGWISDARNHIWVAAGIEFESFRFLTGRLLALAQFTTSGQQEFSVSLLGRAAIDFPRAGGDKFRYAHIEVVVDATYDTTSDELRVFAALASGSFLVHPSCQLTGQAALCIWFGRSAHPGDFVLSIGGYHDKFHPPNYYPHPQRLQLQWSVSDKVAIRGSCYGALTRSAFMVGGELDVSFHTSGLNAWLKAGIDALVQWDPFHYALTIKVEVGASIDFWPYFHGSVSVSLDVWGPPTCGVARVHVLLWDFEIKFGDSRPPAPQLATWDQFVQRMLPNPVVQALPVSGLVSGPDPTKTPDPTDPWLVSRQGFTFATQAAVPIQQVRLGATPVRPTKIEDRQPIHVRPVGAKDVRSTHYVKLTHEGQDVDLTVWTLEAPVVCLPEGLWGEPLAGADTEPAPEQSLSGVNGLRFTSPPSTLTPTIVKSTEKTLGQEWVYAKQVPVRSGDPAPAGPERTGTVRDDLAEHLVGTRASRLALLEVLVWHDVLSAHDPSLTPEDPLDGYASSVRAYLRAEPMRQTKD